MNPSIRPARVADAAGIAAVQVTTWQHAYRGLVPDHVLDTMSTADRAQVWTARLLDLDPSVFAWVAVSRTDEVVGFVFAGPCRDESARGGPPDGGNGSGEIFALYVLPDHQRLGIGAALLTTAVDAMRTVGCEVAMLWVLRGNAPARAFYERCGWVDDGVERLVSTDLPVPEVRYRRVLVDR